MSEWWKSDNKKSWKLRLEDMQAVYDAFMARGGVPEPPLEIISYQEYLRRTVGPEGAKEVTELERMYGEGPK